MLVIVVKFRFLFVFIYFVGKLKNQKNEEKIRQKAAYFKVMAEDHMAQYTT